MPKARTSKRHEDKKGIQSGVQVVPRDYAGKWIARPEGGRRIIAVADSFESCEQAAIQASFPPDQTAIERVPATHFRLTGSGM